MKLETLPPNTSVIHRMLHVVQTIWHILTRPPESLTDRAEQRRTRLLSGVLITVFVVGVLILVIRLIQTPSTIDDPDYMGAVGALGAVMGLYVLAQRGYTNFAAAALIAIMLLLFVGVAFAPGSLNTLLYFATIPVLLTAVFFSVRQVLLVTAIAIVAPFGLLEVSDTLDSLEVVNAVQFIVLSSAVILTYINHNHSLEEIRRAELQSAYDQVRASEAQLEQRVRVRTRDIELAMDVSKQMTTELDLDALLPQLAERTRAAFALYHVSVYLYDPALEAMVLRAATGQVGEHMLDAGMGWSLQHGRSVVARAARTGQAVIENDTENSEHHAPNRWLLETRSELAVPMLIGKTLIGVLDMQATVTDRFEATDVRVLTSLAEQLAIAARNAQLFTSAENARREAERANRVKSQFLAAMSHELRTPLNAILNFSQFISTGMVGEVNQEQVDLLTKINTSGKHLLALINDVLDISKIESGALNLLVDDDLDLNAELATVIATAESMLEEKPAVQLHVEADDDLPRIIGDQRRIRQIMLNLVSNACKFAEVGHVALRLQQQGDEIVFTVDDTGPGIPPDEHETIFDTFHQTEAGLRQGGGTGLGLPISRKLAEIHGGRLWLESTPGQGSTFYVALPVRALHLVKDMPQTRKLPS